MIWQLTLDRYVPGFQVVFDFHLIDNELDQSDERKPRGKPSSERSLGKNCCNDWIIEGGSGYCSLESLESREKSPVIIGSLKYDIVRYCTIEVR